MKRFLLMSLFFLQGLVATARTPAFRWGMEWGYTANVYEYHKNIYQTESEPHYLAPADIHSGFSYSTNAFILGSAGVDFLKRSNFSVVGGYAGIYRDRRCFPLCLRYSFHFHGVQNDGFFAKATGGIGIPENGGTLCRIASIGGGYSIALKEKCSLAFTLSLRGTFDNPPVWDSIDNTFIDKKYVRRNDAAYVSINIGTALSF